MIKIDLEKKLDKVGLRLSDFKDKYIEDILDYEHEIVTTTKNGRVDRFILNIILNNNVNVTYKLERIFFDLYK